MAAAYHLGLVQAVFLRTSVSTGTYPGERGKGRGEVGGILTTPKLKTSFPTVDG